VAVSERDVGGIGALADPTRRALYEYVCAAVGPVGRDAAATSLDLARHQAKFHLDRLEEAGLLDAVYARPEGRGGPGAGRPAKLYRRSGREIAVTLPERRYDLAGRLMAAAISSSAERGGAGVLDALDEAAAAHGAALGESVAGGGDDAGDDSLLDAVVPVLEDNGYEPRRDDDHVLLVNCPFHALAQEHTALVCRMNHVLLTAMADTVCSPSSGIEARLDPGPERCCVVLRGRTRAAG
jgi:predicted ArsR family transcriptional regulator